LHSLKARLRNNFNVAVAQIGEEDKWQKTVLAVAGVERDRKITNSVLSNVINYLERCDSINMIDCEMELF